MTWTNHLNGQTICYFFAMMVISIAVTTCLAYMTGYYDGYHAGAVIYVGGQP